MQNFNIVQFTVQELNTVQLCENGGVQWCSVISVISESVQELGLMAVQWAVQLCENGGTQVVFSNICDL